MVGLPARGKSFISKKLERFLQWRGEQVQIFNVGDRRRQVASKEGMQGDASFFGEQNRGVREEIAHGVLMEMIRWLRAGDESDSAYHCGANIAFLSQFAGEEEILFPPCTMLVVVPPSEAAGELSTHVQGAQGKGIRVIEVVPCFV